MLFALFQLCRNGSGRWRSCSRGTDSGGQGHSERHGSNGGVQHRAHAQRAMKAVKLNEKQRHDCSRHCPQHIC